MPLYTNAKKIKLVHKSSLPTVISTVPRVSSPPNCTSSSRIICKPGIDPPKNADWHFTLSRAPWAKWQPSSAVSQHMNLVSQLLRQFLRYLRGRTFQVFRFLSFLRNVHALDLLQIRPDRLLDVGQRNFAQRLVFRLLDADQGGVTELVDSRLNGEHCRQRHFYVLKEAGLELAFHLDAALALLDLHDDGRVRPAQQFGENHAGLGKSVIVRLQTGKNKVERFLFDGCGEGAGGVEGVEAHEGMVFEMNGAVGPLG